MVNVTFYNFTKEHNSTKQPASGAGASFACLVKEPCDILAPVIELDTPDPVSYNYAYIPAWNRYYFITSIRFNAGLWELTARVDVLATYRAAIGAEELYVLRSSARRNGYIRDNYYPMTARFTRTGIVLGDGDPGSFNSGVYVISVIGKNTGTTTIYQMQPSQFSIFVESLLGMIETASGAVPVASQLIINAILNPTQYITNVMWFPSPFTVVSQLAGPMFVGLWDSNVAAVDVINDPIQIAFNETVTIPKHPQSGRGQYLNCEPFTQYFIEFDPFGVIPLDASKLVGIETLDITVYGDALTGMGILKVRAAGGEIVASVNGQWGVPLPLSAANVGSGAVIGTAGAIGSFIGGAITGNAALMAGAATAGVSNIADALAGAVSTSGSSGSYIAQWQPKIFNAVFHYVPDPDNSKLGSPLMEDVTPASLGGFMLIQNGDVPINGTEAESEEIKRILESGFYYE